MTETNSPAPALQPGLDSLSKSFEPVAIEAHWGPEWEQRGYAKAGYRGTQAPKEGVDAFSIQLPPPNVTGTLHMGHAFNQTIMDSLTRYHRMKGDNTVWIPGTDHAGIATQIVVERQLQEQKITPPRAGPQELRRAHLGVEGKVGQHHHGADAPHGRHRRLEPRILHDGRGPLERRHRNLRAALRRGPHLPWQAPGQLGPGAQDLGERPGGRERRRRRIALAHRLPAGRRQRHAGGGDHAARDHAGRHGGDGPSRRRSLPTPRRPQREAAAGRQAHSDHRGRLRRQGFRHRRRQGHAGPRLQRLCGRPAPQAADDRRPDARRDRQRQRARKVPRHGPLRGPQGHRGRPRCAGPPGRGQEAQVDGAALCALGCRRRADADRSVVRGDDQARKRRHLDRAESHRRGEVGRGALRARELGQHLQPLDGEHPGLDDLAPALVGPSDPGLVRRRRQRLCRPR